MSANILITGASGFIGYTLCCHAAKSGFAVRAGYRQLQESCSIFESVAIGEITGVTNWRHALEGVEVVVHLAGRAHVRKNFSVDLLTEFRTVNVEGAINLARQAACHGVKRFLFISSIGVNGTSTHLNKPFSEVDRSQPHNAYALSKWEAELGLMRVANETGLEVVIIRPPLVYGFGAPGNFGALKRAVQSCLPLPFGLINNQRSIVALDNLVDFILTCMIHPRAANQIFLVSDGRDLSTTELVRGMAQAAGVQARLLPVPVWALQASASLLGKGDVVQRLCGNLQVDISKARGLLDWIPPVTVDEGLRRAMAI